MYVLFVSYSDQYHSQETLNSSHTSFSQLTLDMSESYRKHACPGFDPVTPPLMLNNSWQYLFSCYSCVFSCFYNDSYTHIPNCFFSNFYHTYLVFKRWVINSYDQKTIEKIHFYSAFYLVLIYLTALAPHSRNVFVTGMINPTSADLKMFLNLSV